MGLGHSPAPNPSLQPTVKVFAVSTEPAAFAESIGTADQPRLFFFTDQDGPALLDLLSRPGLLDLLAAQRYGVALSVARLDAARAQAARLLNAA